MCNTFEFRYVINIVLCIPQNFIIMIKDCVRGERCLFLHEVPHITMLHYYVLEHTGPLVQKNRQNKIRSQKRHLLWQDIGFFDIRLALENYFFVSSQSL